MSRLGKILLFFVAVFFAWPVFAAQTAGDAQGKVTLIEFFDYQCPHCRHMADVIRQLMQKNPQMRVQYVVLPILGSASVFEAKASLASTYQNKFSDFHTLLLGLQGMPSDEDILKAAKRIKLNVPQLKEDMNKPEIQKELHNNFVQAEEMEVSAVPVFFLEKTGGSPKFRYDGEVSLATLQQAVNSLQYGS